MPYTAGHALELKGVHFPACGPSKVNRDASEDQPDQSDQPVKANDSITNMTSGLAVQSESETPVELTRSKTLFQSTLPGFLPPPPPPPEESKKRLSGPKKARKSKHGTKRLAQASSVLNRDDLDVRLGSLEDDGTRTAIITGSRTSTQVVDSEVEWPDAVCVTSSSSQVGSSKRVHARGTRGKRSGLPRGSESGFSSPGVSSPASQSLWVTISLSSSQAQSSSAAGSESGQESVYLGNGETNEGLKGSSSAALEVNSISSSEPETGKEWCPVSEPRNPEDFLDSPKANSSKPPGMKAEKTPGVSLRDLLTGKPKKKQMTVVLKVPKEKLQQVAAGIPIYPPEVAVKNVENSSDADDCVITSQSQFPDGLLLPGSEPGPGQNSLMTLLSGKPKQKPQKQKSGKQKPGQFMVVLRLPSDKLAAVKPRVNVPKSATTAAGGTSLTPADPDVVIQRVKQISSGSFFGEMMKSSKQKEINDTLVRGSAQLIKQAQKTASFRPRLPTKTEIHVRGFSQDDCSFYSSIRQAGRSQCRKLRKRQRQTKEYASSVSSQHLFAHSLQPRGPPAGLHRFCVVPSHISTNQQNIQQLISNHAPRVMANRSLMRQLEHLGEPQGPETQLWYCQHSPRRAEDVLTNGDRAQLVKRWISATFHSLKLNPHSRDLRQKPASGPKSPDSLDDFIVEDDDEEDTNRSSSEIDESPQRMSGSVEAGSETEAEADSDGSQLLTEDEDEFGSPRGKPRFPIMLLHGETGAGKTSAVYAAAHELAGYVHEINASQNRSRGDLFKVLKELSTTHLVHHSRQLRPELEPQSLASRELPAGFQKALILLEDVDVLFERDRTFWSLVEYLMKHSRRPVVLTCQDLRFVPGHILEALQEQNTVVHMTEASLGLQIETVWAVCVCHETVVAQSLLQEVLRATRGNVPKALAFLQLWCGGVGKRMPGSVLAEVCDVPWPTIEEYDFWDTGVRYSDREAAGECDSEAETTCESENSAKSEQIVSVGCTIPDSGSPASGNSVVPASASLQPSSSSDSQLAQLEQFGDLAATLSGIDIMASRSRSQLPSFSTVYKPSSGDDLLGVRNIPENMLLHVPLLPFEQNPAENVYDVLCCAEIGGLSSRDMQSLLEMRTPQALFDLSEARESSFELWESKINTTQLFQQGGLGYYDSDVDYEETCFYNLPSSVFACEVLPQLRDLAAIDASVDSSAGQVVESENLLEMVPRLTRGARNRIQTYQRSELRGRLFAGDSGAFQQFGCLRKMHDGLAVSSMV